MKLPLFAIWLLANPILAQVAIRIDLSGEWRTREGDDAAWARPDFDDSAWSGTTLQRWADRSFQDSPANTAWYRKRIDVPVESAGRQLEITLGTFAYEYEVWCNGVRAGETPAEPGPPRPRTFAIPSGLAPPGKQTLIALRAPRASWQGPFPTRISALPDIGPYLVTDASSAPREAVQLALLRRERLAAAGFVTGVLRVFLALMLLIAWLTATHRREFIALTMLLGCDAATRLWESFSIARDAPDEAYAIAGFLSWVSSSLLAWFALEVFGVRARKARIAIWLPLVQVLLYSHRTSDPSLAWPKAALEIALLVLALVMARGGFRRDGWKSGPGWMAVAIAILTFFESQRIGSLVFMNVYRQAGGYLFHTYDVAVSLLAAGITVYLLLALGADRREKERLASEMEAGRSIQNFLLAAPPSTGPWQTEAAYRPALEVGGDFYWTRVTGDGALMLAIGDVSGKGLKAAMLVSVAIGILRNERSTSPGAVLRALNDGLAGHIGGGFVTCCCARLDPSGSVTIANAGHPPVYRDGREVGVEAGLPLGIAAGVSYAEAAVEGERFTFVSDGVVEAENAQRELFGFDRTREISAKSAREIAEAAKAWGQNDDITVVTVRRSA